MKKIVFIHIPKSAGTSFRHLLCRVFGDDKVSPAFIASRMTPEERDRLDRFDVIAGHISIDDVDRFFPDADAITIVRDPISRCLSWYHFARMQGAMDFADVSAAQNNSLSDFFSLDKDIVYRNIFNRQVRQLGGHVLDGDACMEKYYDRALRTIDRCVWVGRFEYLRSDINRLAKIFLSTDLVNIPHLNPTKEYAGAGEIDSTIKEKIAAYNRYDIKLYEAVMRRVGS